MATSTVRDKKGIQSYQDLVVWNKGVDLVLEVYNVAEGFGRWHSKEFSRFLLIANGSVKELETHLHICLRLGYLGKEQTQAALGLTEEISKMVFAIKRKLGAR